MLVDKDITCRYGFSSILTQRSFIFFSFLTLIYISIYIYIFIYTCEEKHIYNINIHKEIHEVYDELFRMSSFKSTEKLSAQIKCENHNKTSYVIFLIYLS